MGRAKRIRDSATELPNLTDLSDRELIDRVKAAKLPTAKKWSRARKLASGERTRAIAHLETLAAV